MERKFVLWNEQKDGAIPRDEQGNISTAGVLGELTRNNVYLTTYAVFPDGERLDDLLVGQCIRGVQYNLSGEKGYYEVYRVR